MKSLTFSKSLFLLLIVAAMATGAAKLNSSLSEPAHLQKLMQQGNYKEALVGYRQRLESPATDPQQLPADLSQAVQCLNSLNQVSDFDEMIEAAIKTHSGNWRLLEAAANQYSHIAHHGYQISGKFERGHHRGGGKVLNSRKRDRVRAMQLWVQALQSAEADAKPAEAGRVAQRLAQTMLNGQPAWQLQSLTDLTELPDHEEGWGHGYSSMGAPVDSDNRAVFHTLPASWKTAKSDGERWRWALAHMVELDPNLRHEELTSRANFLASQFGVPTLGHMLQPLLARSHNGPTSDASIYTLHTLQENETLARLATGIQRFQLPDEHNFVLLYQQALELAQEKGQKGQAFSSANQLGNLFANRRQYPRSAEYWRIALEYATHKNQKKNAQNQIDQIVKPWGQFEQSELQPAGQGASFEYRFRNGQSVEFTAQSIKVNQLLTDIKEYIASKPKQLDWQKLQIEQLGYRLVQKGEKKYLDKQVAKWRVEIDSPANHFDSRETIASPLSKAGAYLVTAKMRDGNTSKIVLWIADTAIVKKRLTKETLYYVADAVTGKPIEKAHLELFGYLQHRPKPREMRIDILRQAEFTDAHGQVAVPISDKKQHNRYQWLTIATTPQGRLAFLGFHNVWSNQQNNRRPSQAQTFAMTDRPVYRPGQKVHLKLWIARSLYDAPQKSEFAHKAFQLEIYSPRGEKIHTQSLTANAFGGVAADWELPAGATLGQYRFRLVNYGGGNFRVEEYKKPEFEVTVDAPDEPLALGDKFDATITARYYFGEPVREGTVKYKVTRTSRTAQWFPVAEWDWLYGAGYWWFGNDYGWYPGWSRWGCESPYPWWGGWQRPQPPEVIAEGELPLSDDGTVKISIDSALAKELHPDQDHDYRIVAEVVDRSRRTIVGSGSVLVARQPFKVHAWTDRGFYSTGDTLTAHFQARRPDGKPVAGSGKLRLFSITYPAKDPSKPIETEIRTWDLPTGSDGTAQLQIKASEPGQYRLSYEVTSGPTNVKDKKEREADKKQATIEGGYFFTIVGKGFDGSDFRFNDLEVIPDRKQYKPGEKVQLQINTNRRGSSVLLFVRPQNGTYSKPRFLQLQGKSTTVEIDVTQQDMPNFFIEAQTISNGKVHTVAKQLVVPPAKRVINVEVAPSSAAYRPGQEATVKIRLTDATGEPIAGDTVLTVYDKSLDYIAGGSNVGDIRKLFWSWKRNHQPSTEHNLNRYSSNLVPKGEQAMQTLGVFGHLVKPSDSEQAQGILLLRGRASMRGVDLPARQSKNSPMSISTGAPMEMDAMAEASKAGGMAFTGNEMADEAGSSPENLVTPTVRKQFADTAYWSASIETGTDGLAEVTFPMAENLTNWTFKVWSLGHGTRVGSGEAEAVTRKNLLVRLQTPRFLVDRDEVVISANVHNYLSEAKQVRVRLELDGPCLVAIGSDTKKDLEQVVTIEPNGEKRVDWRLKATTEGTATLRALALSDEESDAMQLEIPVKVHGIEKLIPYSGVIAADGNRAAFEVNVPKERRESQTRLEVRFSPTLAGAMVDALPYLIDYPYGCTEQTLNRFLPAVITQKTLRSMGVDLAAIRDKKTNLNPQELAEADESAQQRAEDWKRYKANPVFDEAELDKVVKAGVNRLAEMQLADGGWGWFSGHGEWSSPHTTAVVVRGLVVAKQNDVALLPSVLERGVQWLERYRATELAKLANHKADGSRRDDNKPYKRRADNLDALVYLTLIEAQQTGIGSNPQKQTSAMRQHLYADRTHLAVYSLATFGLALQHEIDQQATQATPLDDSLIEMRDMVVRNISQFVVQDAENQTAYLNLPGGHWWHWYGSEYEAHAYYLKLLAATDPKSDVASGLVKYLLNNRKHATYWNSTRDTALVIEAMADYLAATGEGKDEMTVEVWLNGQRQKTVKITPQTLFSFDNQFLIEGVDLAAGRHTLELRKQGQGRLYFNAYLSVFTLEDDIQAAGLELKVHRKYYRLTPVDSTQEVAGGQGQVVTQKVEKYKRTEVPNLGTLQSGDLVEIELTIESKNDYEYILLEDLKAAGLEPVEVRSGYNGNEMGAYIELRDDRVSLFVQRLARGTHSVSYRMRAETPGKFSALPTQAHAMYAPELKANSNELKLHLVDQP